MNFRMYKYVLYSITDLIFCTVHNIRNQNTTNGFRNTLFQAINQNSSIHSVEDDDKISIRSSKS
jgi:hypothetical protein